jgi:hypothetical protein
MPTSKGTYTPPTIIKYEVFTVKSTSIDDRYGSLKIVSTDGKNYSIGNKRIKLFDVFQIGAEVKVGWTIYKSEGKPDQNYIATAEQTGNHSVIQGIEDEIEPDSEKLNPEVKEIPKPVIMPEHKTNPDPKNRAFALSYSKDLWCKRLETGITCSDIDVIATATVFCAYLDNGAIITKK